jgi:ATPase subunit of ABC transporter with duplicated ATPase domains
MNPSNLQLLDEPTNLLDLEARQVVIKALNAYKGTLIVVSHDRFLLDSVTQKTAVLNEGQIALFPGTFTETRHLHRTAKPMSVRREKYVVRKAFKDHTKGVRYAYGAEIELTAEEVETADVFRRALRFGWMEPT